MSRLAVAEVCNFILQLEQKGQWQRALLSLQISRAEYSTDGMRSTYAPLMVALAKRGQWESAMGLAAFSYNHPWEEASPLGDCADEMCRLLVMNQDIHPVQRALTLRKMSPWIGATRFTQGYAAVGGHMRWERAIQLYPQAQSGNNAEVTTALVLALVRGHRFDQLIRMGKLVRREKNGAGDPPLVFSDASLSVLMRTAMVHSPDGMPPLLQKVHSLGLYGDEVREVHALSMARDGDWQGALSLVGGDAKAAANLLSTFSKTKHIAWTQQQREAMFKKLAAANAPLQALDLLYPTSWEAALTTAVGHPQFSSHPEHLAPFAPNCTSWQMALRLHAKLRERNLGNAQDLLAVCLRDRTTPPPIKTLASCMAAEEGQPATAALLFAAASTPRWEEALRHASAHGVERNAAGALAAAVSRHSGADWAAAARVLGARGDLGGVKNVVYLAAPKCWLRALRVASRAKDSAADVCRQTLLRRSTSLPLTLSRKLQRRTKPNAAHSLDDGDALFRAAQFLSGGGFIAWGAVVELFEALGKTSCWAEALEAYPLSFGSGVKVKRTLLSSVLQPVATKQGTATPSSVWTAALQLVHDDELLRTPAAVQSGMALLGHAGQWRRGMQLLKDHLRQHHSLGLDAPMLGVALAITKSWASALQLASSKKVMFDEGSSRALARHLAGRAELAPTFEMLAFTAAGRGFRPQVCFDWIEPLCLQGHHKVAERIAIELAEQNWRAGPAMRLMCCHLEIPSLLRLAELNSAKKYIGSNWDEVVARAGSAAEARSHYSTGASVGLLHGHNIVKAKSKVVERALATSGWVEALAVYGELGPSRLTDATLGLLCAELGAAGRWEETTVVVSSQ